MSSDVDLDALAARIARELSRADQRGNRESGIGNGAPGTENPEAGRLATTSGSLGVRYVRDNARIAEFIDHTLLKAETTRADIDQLCSEALEHEFAAVCVNPVWVARCAERLQGSRVAVATVVGFPLGANQSEIKAAETSLAVRQGATEIDNRDYIAQWKLHGPFKKPYTKDYLGGEAAASAGRVKLDHGWKLAHLNLKNLGNDLGYANGTTAIRRAGNTPGVPGRSGVFGQTSTYELTPPRTWNCEAGTSARGALA